MKKIVVIMIATIGLITQMEAQYGEQHTRDSSGVILPNGVFGGTVDADNMTGTPNTIPLWTGTHSIGNSPFIQSEDTIIVSGIELHIIRKGSSPNTEAIRLQDSDNGGYFFAGYEDTGEYGFIGAYKVGAGFQDLVFQPEGGNTRTAGSFAIGSGSAITSAFTGSLVYNCGEIAAGVDSTFSISVTGAVAGSPVQVGVSVAAEAGLIITAECTTTNVITVRISNHFLVAAVNPASRTYKVLITNF